MYGSLVSRWRQKRRRALAVELTRNDVDLVAEAQIISPLEPVLLAVNHSETRPLGQTDSLRRVTAVLRIDDDVRNARVLR